VFRFDELRFRAYPQDPQLQEWQGCYHFEHRSRIWEKNWTEWIFIHCSHQR